MFNNIGAPNLVLHTSYEQDSRKCLGEIDRAELTQPLSFPLFAGLPTINRVVIDRVGDKAVEIGTS